MALIDLKTQDGTAIGNPDDGNYFVFLDSNNSNILTTRDSAGVDTVYGTGGGLDNLGWAAFTDTTYTSGAPFTILSGVDTALRFNLDSTVDTYAPTGTTFATYFEDTTWRIMSPAVGQCFDFRLQFKCKPSANTKVLTTTYSIGTGVGSQIPVAVYSRDLRTSGVGTAISQTTLVYSLDTFITNGMQIILNANTNCDIYDISMVINRTS